MQTPAFIAAVLLVLSAPPTTEDYCSRLPSGNLKAPGPATVDYWLDIAPLRESLSEAEVCRHIEKAWRNVWVCNSEPEHLPWYEFWRESPDPDTWILANWKIIELSGGDLDGFARSILESDAALCQRTRAGHYVFSQGPEPRQPTEAEAKQIEMLFAARLSESGRRYLPSETEISGDLARAWVGASLFLLWRGGDPASPTGGWEVLGTVGLRMH